MTVIKTRKSRGYVNLDKNIECTHNPPIRNKKYRKESSIRKPQSNQNHVHVRRHHDTDHGQRHGQSTMSHIFPFGFFITSIVAGRFQSSEIDGNKKENIDVSDQDFIESVGDENTWDIRTNIWGFYHSIKVFLDEMYSTDDIEDDVGDFDNFDATMKNLTSDDPESILPRSISLMSQSATSGSPNLKSTNTSQDHCYDERPQRDSTSFFLDCKVILKACILSFKAAPIVDHRHRLSDHEVNDEKSENVMTWESINCAKSTQELHVEINRKLHGIHISRHQSSMVLPALATYKINGSERILINYITPKHQMYSNLEDYSSAWLRRVDVLNLPVECLGVRMLHKCIVYAPYGRIYSNYLNLGDISPDRFAATCQQKLREMSAPLLYTIMYCQNLRIVMDRANTTFTATIENPETPSVWLIDIQFIILEVNGATATVTDHGTMLHEHMPPQDLFQRAIKVLTLIIQNELRSSVSLSDNTGISLNDNCSRLPQSQPQSCCQSSCEVQLPSQQSPTQMCTQSPVQQRPGENQPIPSHNVASTDSDSIFHTDGLSKALPDISCKPMNNPSQRGDSVDCSPPSSVTPTDLDNNDGEQDSAEICNIDEQPIHSTNDVPDGLQDDTIHRPTSIGIGQKTLNSDSVDSIDSGLGIQF